jgi:hypothetical protein
MGDKRYTIAEVAEMAQALGLVPGQKHDVNSTALQPIGLHGNIQSGTPSAGPFGAFSFPGPDPRIHSTLVRQPTGRTLAQALANRIVRDNDLMEQPMRETLTGVTDEACVNASGFCEDPPSVGFIKGCEQTRKYGQLSLKTHMEDTWQTGHIRNIAEQARQIQNLGPAANPFIPSEFFNPMNDTRSALMREWFLMGVRIMRHFSQVLVNGNPNTAYTSTECGWIKEFEGLGAQIKTGYVDVHSGTLCPSLDSIVEDFGSNLEDTVGGGDPRGLVELMGDVMYSLVENAGAFGEMNPGYVLVMRKRLFRELVKLWACNYTTARCNTNANAMATAQGITVNMDGTAQNNFRLDMERNQYLQFDDAAYPVLFSDGLERPGIAEDAYRSDILIMPLNFIDMEYYPADNPYATEWINATGANDDIDFMNAGMYKVIREMTRGCLEYIFQAKLRAHLLTPQLSARIDNIEFESRVKTRDARPDESWYIDGGDTQVANWI